MAEAEVEAGFSIGDFFLGAKVDLEAKLDTVIEHLKSIEARERRYQEEGPTFVNLVGAVSLGSGSPPPTSIDLGGPTYGRVWEVRQLIVGGITWATTVAGTAQFVIAASPPGGTSAAAIPVNSLQDVAGSLPSVAFYSAGQFRVIHPNHVYVVIVGGTASTVYTVGGDALDLPAHGLQAVTPE